MTREEAMKIITNALQSDESKYTEKIDKALALAQKALNQEPILDKIRAEINELPSYVAKFNGGDFAIHIDKEKVFDIIDKYKSESEVQE